MRRELKNLLKGVQDSTATERKDATERLGQWFSDPDNVAKIDAKGDNREWEEIFESIFSAIHSERDIYMRKGKSAIAETRLERTSATFRIVVESGIKYLNYKSLKLIIDHIRKVIHLGGALVTPIASNYARALLSITSYHPHLESLKSDYWQYIARLAWAIVLGDELSGDYSWYEKDPKESRQPFKNDDVDTESASTASPVMLICASIIHQLFSSPFAPLIDDLKTPHSMLVKFVRYFIMYPKTVTSHVDMIPALRYLLERIELNNISDMMWFSRRIWGRLIDLISTRIRTEYIQVLVIIKTLLPYYVRVAELTASTSSVNLIDSTSSRGLANLSQAIQQCVSMKSGIDYLSLESLRLELTPSDEQSPMAFCSRTLRNGFFFSPTDAYTWSLLEIQADCIYFLYSLEEASPQSQPHNDEPRTKRRRISSYNTLESLLSDVSSPLSSNFGSFQLQTLLFLIERHWERIYSTHQHLMLTALFQTFGKGDFTDTCVLLCLAALAGSPDLALGSSTPTPINWGTVWLHSYRRLTSSSPQVSRAAAHALHVLIVQKRVDLTIVSKDVGQFALDFRQDEDSSFSQAPTAFDNSTSNRQAVTLFGLTDSICAILVDFLSIADGDATLCRLQLEDSTRKWLRKTLHRIVTVDRAEYVGVRMGRVSKENEMIRRSTLRSDLQVSIQDLLGLLQAICGTPIKPKVYSRFDLPYDPFVHAIQVYQSDCIVRNFFINAAVPNFIQADAISTSVTNDSEFQRTTAGTSIPATVRARNEPPINGEYAPSSRELRTLAMLEDLLGGIVANSDEGGADGSTSAGIQLANTSLVEKCVVVARVTMASLSLQATLEVNGTRSDGALYQLAYDIFLTSIPWRESSLRQQRWSASQWSQVVNEFKSIVWLSDNIVDPVQRAADQMFLRPQAASGIPRERQRRLAPDPSIVRKTDENGLTWSLLSVIWSQKNAGDVVERLSTVCRGLLQAISTRWSAIENTATDEGYLFLFESPIDNDGMVDYNKSIKVPSNVEATLAMISMSLIATTSTIIFGSGNDSYTDPLLDNLLLQSQSQAFLILARAYCDCIRSEVLQATSTSAKRILDTVQNSLLKSHELRQSEDMQRVVLDLLDVLSPIFFNQPGDLESTTRNLLYDWAQRKIVNGDSWCSRLHMAKFLARLFSKIPSQRLRAKSRAVDSMDLDDDLASGAESDTPLQLLSTLIGDGDARVRVAASIFYATLLQDVTDFNLAIEVYNGLINNTPEDAGWLEGMLTRSIALSNAMIVSSPVRRGAYWHLLELPLESPQYAFHLISLLESVASRLGLESLSTLFVAYASQVASHIHNVKQEFLKFQPRVLGFRTFKECAESTLSPLVSTIIAYADERKRSDPDQRLPIMENPFFDRFCLAVKKDKAEALKECFNPLIAMTIILAHEGEKTLPKHKSAALRKWIWNCATECNPSVEPEAYLRETIDRIVAAILSYAGDVNYRPDGPIARAVRVHSGSDWENIEKVYNQLHRFRLPTDFSMHEVTAPAASTDTILFSLAWVTGAVPNLQDGQGTATIYHAIHHLFVAVHSTPLVNEQLRYVQSLCLWLSLSHAILCQPRMIHTLLIHALTILPQEDLMHSAQSIVSWALEQVRLNHHPSHETGLAVVLGRIGELGVQYSQQLDLHTRQLGSEILLWIENEIELLTRDRRLREEIENVILLWPTPRKFSSSPHTQNDSRTDFPAVKILSMANKNVVGRFRAVRQLNNIPLYSAETFATEHFWALKESIPSDSLPIQEDAEAFSELLYKTSGRFDWIRFEIEGDDSLVARHVAQSGQSMKLLIIKWLFDRMDFAVAPSLYSIHKTLRMLCHPDCGEASTEDHQELILFRMGGLEPLPRSDRTLSALKQPDFQDIVSDSSRWIQEISVLFAEVMSSSDLFYAQLPPLLKTETLLARELLPVLVHQLLVSDASNAFGHALQPTLSTYFRTIIRSPATDTKVLQVVLDIVLHLRNFPQALKKDPVSYDKWLNLDFRALCDASMRCGAYTTALFFLELANEYSTEAQEQDNSDVEDILYEIYRHIDEPDGFYAINASDIRKQLSYKFQHESKWESAFQLHVSQYEGSHVSLGSDKVAPSNLQGIIDSLYAFGFNHLAVSLARSIPAKSSSRLDYSLAWRTEVWDLPESRSREEHGAVLYKVLRTVHKGRNIHTTRELCDITICREIQRLKDINAENVAEIRRSIQVILALREVQLWVKQEQEAQDEISQPLWMNEFSKLSSDFEFSMAEEIVATRVSLIRSLSRSVQRNQIGTMDSSLLSSLLDSEARCLVNLSANARKANLSQVAFSGVLRAQQIVRSENFYVSKEFAEALWTQKEEAIAIRLLEELIQKKDAIGTNLDQNMEISRQWALLYARLGSWSFAACSSHPRDIRARYFGPAVKILDPLDQMQRRDAKMVYYHYADFANKQLQQLEGAEEYKRQRNLTKKVQAEIESLESSIQSTRSQVEKNDMTRKSNKAKLWLAADMKSIEDHETALRSFLEQSISMYAHYMEASDEHDQEIAIRFCGLWFSKFDSEIAAESIKYALQKISTYKLLFLAHQLTARLGTQSSSEGGRRNQRFLNQLVEGMCLQHPYHSLFQVLSASESNPKKYSLKDEGKAQDVLPGRHEEAKKIVENVRITLQRGADAQYSRPKNFMNLMTETFRAYVEWAKYPIKQLNYKSGQWPKIPNVALKQWTWNKKPRTAPEKSLPLPVVTVEVPIDVTGNYLNITTVHYYEQAFTVAGGVNTPKITVCMDSAGKSHKQLFKGEGDDDLRQDAVMEQVFQLINILLAQDRKSKRRNLSLRTYKVVPLAEKTGILQFVNNTETMATWLPDAHTKYRPRDTPYKVTYNTMKEQGPKHAAEKLKVFLKIRENFKPVLRHFFTESNKQPQTWYAKRLTWSRSVAVCSIGGYILGLGDRHLSNLLMDAQTGELIHIDLGIAFDQGKFLPVPETVPFRLTADIVDGMGIAGTEGVFRRCAEETLRVLREGSDTIKTVLEVFKFDPLHSWTATPGKLRRMQDVEVSSGPEEDEEGFLTHETSVSGAERAIGSVVAKLDASLSVEYMVNELILEARDLGNLARIFYGWSPQC